MNGDLPVGTQVMLSPETRMQLGVAWNPLNTIGTIIDPQSRPDFHPSDDGVYVVWESYHCGGMGVYYTQRDSDLIPIHRFEFTSRTAAREAAKRSASLIVVDLGEGVEKRWSLTTKEI